MSASDKGSDNIHHENRAAQNQSRSIKANSQRLRQLLEHLDNGVAQVPRMREGLLDRVDFVGRLQAAYPHRLGAIYQEEPIRHDQVE